MGRLQPYAWTAATLLGIAAFVLGTTASRASACSCVTPSIERSYNQHSDVLTVSVIYEQALEGQRLYLAVVNRAHKGCLQADDLVVLLTPESSAACGALLGSEPTLIHGTRPDGSDDTPVLLEIDQCDYNLPVSLLSPADQRFLDTRTVCCGDRCQCADPSGIVNCLVDPCQVAPACAEGECVANYCGGCRAEFYNTEGEAVCEPPGECQVDADCPAGEWCRSTELSAANGDPSSLECVPFVGLGERCEGFTLPWLFERCEPGLTCDTVDMIADAPGVCRPTCATSAECAECQSDADCMRTGCSSHICAAEAVGTTCEFRPEYACYQDDAITPCGCTDGVCSFSDTEALRLCLEDAAGSEPQVE